MSESKSTLPALVSQANSLAEALLESGGELTPEIESALTINEKELGLKVDSYAIFVDRLEYEAGYFKAKAKELQAAAKVLENAQERLKENLKNAMRALKQDEIKGQDYKFKLSRSRPKLILDEKVLPGDFKTQVVSYEPDKDKIQDAINAGLEVPGAKIEETFSLRKYINKVAK